MEKHCAICGKKFDTKRKDKRFCSTSCRVINYERKLDVIHNKNAKKVVTLSNDIMETRKRFAQLKMCFAGYIIAKEGGNVSETIKFTKRLMEKLDECMESESLYPERAVDVMIRIVKELNVSGNVSVNG